MGQVIVLIGGRNYPLACRDGDEAHLMELAGMIESKTGGLTAALGAMSEPRLLLMAGLLIADELFESRKHGAVPAVAGTPVSDDGRVVALAERLEALAGTLERHTAEYSHPKSEPADAA